MKKILFVLPLLLTACGTKSYTYEVAFLLEGTGSTEVTMKFPGSTGGVTCKIVLEKKEVARNTGKTATCQSEITEDTEN